jgi:hypothetical protein
MMRPRFHLLGQPALTASFELVKDKILFLAKAGLRPKLIADILDNAEPGQCDPLKRPQRQQP